MPREDEKFLNVKFQHKGICTTWGGYGHKEEELLNREDDKNVPKCHYFNKIGHVKKEFHKIIRKVKLRNNNNEENKNKYNHFKINNHEEKYFFKNKNPEK